MLRVPSRLDVPQLSLRSCELFSHDDGRAHDVKAAELPRHAYRIVPPWHRPKLPPARVTACLLGRSLDEPAMRLCSSASNRRPNSLSTLSALLKGIVASIRPAFDELGDFPAASSGSEV